MHRQSPESKLAAIRSRPDIVIAGDIVTYSNPRLEDVINPNLYVWRAAESVEMLTRVSHMT